MGTDRITNGYYRTRYIEKLDANLIDEPIDTIAEKIFNNHYHQLYPARFPHVFPKATWSWFLRDPNSYKSIGESKESKESKESGESKKSKTYPPAAREDHGAEHAARVAMNVVVYLNLYCYFGTSTVVNEILELIREVNKKNPEEKINFADIEKFIKYLQIAALFHDAERHGEGEDHPDWEKAGAKVCKAFLEKLGCSSELADQFSQAAGEKDAKIPNPKAKKTGQKKPVSRKSILQTLVQCADVQDIQRVPALQHVRKNLFSRYVFRPRTRHYILNYLDIWDDLTTNKRGYIDQKKKAALQKELVELSLANRAWLDSQSDLNNACPIEVRLDNGETVVISPGVVPHYDKRVKSRYEYGGFKEVEKSLTASDNLLYAALRKRYNQGKICIDKRQKSTSSSFKGEGINQKQLESLKAKEIESLARIVALYPSFDVLCLSLINLVHQLNILLMQNETRILPEQYNLIPGVIQKMLEVFLNKKSTDDERLEAIKTCKNELSKVLSEGKGKIIAALVFVLSAAVSLVLGIYLAPALGFMTGLLGVKVVGVTVISSTASYFAFWYHQHAGIRDILYQIFEAGHASAKANKQNATKPLC